MRGVGCGETRGRNRRLRLYELPFVDIQDILELSCPEAKRAKHYLGVRFEEYRADITTIRQPERM
jgi:hypothetical protein